MPAKVSCQAYKFVSKNVVRLKFNDSYLKKEMKKQLPSWFLHGLGRGRGKETQVMIVLPMHIA